MTDIDRLEDRLAAVERTVAADDFEEAGLENVSELAEDVERIATRLQDFEERLADLEGKVQAMGGFVANVESVNEGVERQAGAAIGAVDRLETRLDELEQYVETPGDEDLGATAGDVDRAVGRDGRPRDAGRGAADAGRGAADAGRGAPDDGHGTANAGSDVAGTRGDGPDRPERAVDDLVDGTNADEPLFGESAGEEESGSDSDVASDGGTDGGVTPARQDDVERRFGDGGDEEGDDGGDDTDDGGFFTGVFSAFQ